MRVERRAVKVILTQKAEGQLVRNGFADAAGPRGQKLLYTHSVDYCGGVGIAPCRITATGFETGHIDCVFNSKAQSIQWTAIGRRQIKSRYESVTLSNGDDGAVHLRRRCRKVNNPQSLFKEPIFRRAHLAPSGSHQDHGTTGPCFSSPELPDQFRDPDLRYRRRRFSNARTLFAASPCQVDEMTYDQSCQAMAFPETTR